MKVSKQIRANGFKFLTFMQIRKQRWITSTETRHLLKSTKENTVNLLRNLLEEGYIYRLIRGIYLLPSYIPHGGKWLPNAQDLVIHYMQALQANYIVSGVYALGHYRLLRDPNSKFNITVYNDVLTQTIKLDSTMIYFVKVDRASLIGYTPYRLENNLGIINLATLPRAIYDAINDPRYELLKEGYKWLEKHLKSPAFVAKFIDIISPHTPKKTVQRMGYFLETKGVTKGSRKLSQLLDGKIRWTTIASNTDKKTDRIRNDKWKIITDKSKPRGSC